MLRTLYIRDFVIVDQAEINFSNSFTVFSGETGAGKSILIDALSLCLGARTDIGLIRTGAKQADISAVFTVPESLQNWLIEQSITDKEIILRRVIDTQARSKAYINGMPVSLGQLKTIGQQLVDIHGQHAHQSLLQSSTQREILDAQAKLGQKLIELNKIWQAWQKAGKNLKEAKENANYQQAKIKQLELDLEYLNEIAPQANEWQDLCQKQSKLAHGQALLSGASQIIDILDNNELSASHAINSAIQILHDIARHDPSLNEHLASLESASIICTETISSLNNYLDKLELDPASLSKYEKRMSTMFEAARRFNTEPEQLPELVESLNIELTNLSATADLASMERYYAEQEQKYMQLAQIISQSRHKCAIELANNVTQSMQALAMAGGKLQISIKTSKPSSHGIDEVNFLVSGHTGVKPRLLAKVASGGELARISLALSVIASQAARVPCLIFDEVDAGIGGAVAEVVGRLLQQLGQRHQVLCVTHLPQVAAFGKQHFQVSKKTVANKTVSTIKDLNAQDRINEIARMLGGLKITSTTREHAQEMLNNAAS